MDNRISGSSTFHGLFPGSAPCTIFPRHGNAVTLCSAPRILITFLRVPGGILHSRVCVALLPAGCPVPFPSSDLFRWVPFHLVLAFILSWYLFRHRIHPDAHNYLKHVAGNRFCNQGVQFRIQQSAGKNTMVQANPSWDGGQRSPPDRIIDRMRYPEFTGIVVRAIPDIVISEPR